MYRSLVAVTICFYLASSGSALAEPFSTVGDTGTQPAETAIDSNSSSSASSSSSIPRVNAPVREAEGTVAHGRFEVDENRTQSFYHYQGAPLEIDTD